MSTGQVAIVSGANRGISAEVCRQLAQSGYTVILGSRNLARVRKLRPIKGLPIRGLTVLSTELVIPRTCRLPQIDSVDNDHVRDALKDEH